MPERDGYPHGVPSWIDLGTTDVAGATAFYTGLFGWDAMSDQGGTGSYRFMYEPAVRNCYMLPVMNKLDLKQYIIDDD